MRRCREAEDSGRQPHDGSPPEELKPFLDVLAEMLAEALLREHQRHSPVRGVTGPRLNQPPEGLESAPDEFSEESQEV